MNPNVKNEEDINLSQNHDYINNNWDLHSAAVIISNNSKKNILLTKLKNLFYRKINQDINIVVDKQTRFNAYLVRSINQLNHRIALSESKETQKLNKIDAFLKPQISMDIDPNSTQISEKFDYFDFENVFRGSEELIKQRQRNYLIFFQGKEKIVDLGCGRGEFLELLKEQGLTGIGIDTDCEMIERCKNKGLQVIQKDIIDYLQDLPDNTVDGIFSAQVIEHLEFESLDTLFRLSYRKLKPDGVFVVETVNPYNLSAFRCFFLDPSHKKPLFPEFIIYLCRSSGFREINVKYFLPGQHNSEDPDTQWNAGDYAVIAKK